tara:strand:- start:4041 stop:4604 length:564 start_codon:yes stop_codon:yes gene_type:complete
VEKDTKNVIAKLDRSKLGSSAVTKDIPLPHIVEMLAKSTGKRLRPTEKSNTNHVAYGVARGWRVGVFTDHAQYKRAYEGFSDACHQGFTAYEYEQGEAEAYVLKYKHATGQVRKVKSRRTRTPSPEPEDEETDEDIVSSGAADPSASPTWKDHPGRAAQTRMPVNGKEDTESHKAEGSVSSLTEDPK